MNTMNERRTFSESELTGVVETGDVVITQQVRDEVDEAIRSGRFKVEKGKVIYHDPDLKRFSARDAYEINLNGGYFSIEPQHGVAGPPIIAPVNLAPLAYLRELAHWKIPST